MPSNGGEFSGWLDRSAHIAACVKMCKNLEVISDKKKRVGSCACALTRRTTAAYIYIYSNAMRAGATQQSRSAMMV